jgi:hypothetical protein
MAERHDNPHHDNAHRPSRRVILSAAAAVGAVGMLVPADPAAASAATGERQPGRPARPAGADAGAERADATPATAASATGTSEVWGTSGSGHGAGVRGNGRWGVIGEGTHTGVAGAGFVGVRGATSIVQGDKRGVGIWAQAVTAGSTALRADGPSEFNGITSFSRSGVASVRRGSASVTVSGVALTAGTAILATLQDRVNNLYLHAVETDVATGSFTIFLSTAPDRDIRIAWFALG